MSQKEGLENNLQYDTLVFGIDESNHGKFSEFFVAVSTPFLSDRAVNPNYERIFEFRDISRKFTPHISSVTGDEIARDWKYLIVKEEDYEKLGYRRTKCVAAASLIPEFDIPDRKADVHVDGELQEREEMLIRRLLEISLFKNQPYSSSVSVSQLPKILYKPQENINQQIMQFY